MTSGYKLSAQRDQADDENESQAGWGLGQTEEYARILPKGGAASQPQTQAPGRSAHPDGPGF